MWCARLRSIRAYACTSAAQSDSSLIERWSFTICESEQPGYFLNLRGSLASVLRRPTNVISRRSPNNCDVDLAATSKVMTDRSFARGRLAGPTLQPLSHLHRRWRPALCLWHLVS